MKNRIRVGLLMDNERVSNWVYKMLSQIRDGGYADVVLIVHNGVSAKKSDSLFKKISRNIHFLLYALFVRLESKLAKLEPDAFILKDMDQLFPAVPRLTVSPIQGEYTDEFAQSDIDFVRSYNIDVLIQLGFRILAGGILKSARFGIWSFYHGDNKRYRGGPPGFWEVMEGWPETGCLLQMISEDADGGEVLCRSYSQTDKLFVNRNMARYYWKSVSFIPRKLAELYAIGGEEFLSRVKSANQHPHFYSRRLYARPGNLEMIYLSIKHYCNYLLSRLQDFLSYEQWILLYKIDSCPVPSSVISKYDKIIPPKDRFWADPFVISRGDDYYIFFEEYINRMRKGHIACISITKDGKRTVPIKVLEEPYHLSYPYIFSYNNELYMVPESCANRSINLYKCKDFPGMWTFVKKLIADIYAVDTTIIYRDGKWWLFANVRENEGAPSPDELFLFYSSDLLLGEWNSHPQNPIVSDVKSSRPAGRIFQYNDNLYRPSQNNGKYYGGGIKINQIVALTDSEYREVCVSEIEPLWDRRIAATHTINMDKDITVIDGLIRGPRFVWQLR